MTPIEKNIIVVDEHGNILEATYPKRANGLVKKGRARFIFTNMICLACPPETKEKNEMSNTQSKFGNLEFLIDEYVNKITWYSTKKENLLSIIEDDKFLQSVSLVIQNEIATTSFIQKKLKCGYRKAAYMLDAMEALGLITTLNGLSPRKVLPEAREYLDYKSNQPA